MTSKGSGIFLDNETYEKYKRTIWKKALSWNKTTGVPVEELVSEGNLIFCKALFEYEYDRGANFNTFLHLKLDSKFNTFVKTWRLWKAVNLIITKETEVVKKIVPGYSRTKWTQTTVKREWNFVLDIPLDMLNEDNDITSYFEKPVPNTIIKNIEFQEWKENLSAKAKIIVDIATDFPVETLQATGATPSKMIRGAIVKYLKEELKWKTSEAWGAMKEVKEALKTI